MSTEDKSHFFSSILRGYLPGNYQGKVTFLLKNDMTNGFSYKKYYKELGKLVYAMAKADGKIPSSEIEMLEKLISDEIIPLENSTGIIGADLSCYIKFEFEVLEERNIPAMLAFSSFMNYLDHYLNQLNEKQKTLILHVVEKVAIPYKDISKAKQLILEELKGVLAKPNPRSKIIY